MYRYRLSRACSQRRQQHDRRDRAVFAPDPRLCTVPRWPRAAAELAVVSTGRPAIAAPELRDDLLTVGDPGNTVIRA